MYIHLEHDDNIDPRVLRTRELLINSFATLLIERKSIQSVSVQSVTKLAGVNRVTFYAHFTDKYELLNVWARLMFQQSVAEKLPPNAHFDTENLTILISATLEFFIMRSQYRRRINEQLESMFEATVQQELQSVLASMLDKTPTNTLLTPSSNIATFLSWAIFGSLLDWSRAHKDQASEAYVAEIVVLCETIFSKHT
jgi:AcrR family transcriptional regulator